eukprot:CAMPEP_0115022370 /NCGR_PEP_ID=MMETSP0216-20121206/31511_1 /TAXON_ID=223996 /ORGANISM="Protocruzia adherens, Strain Boccale" /LENGTH=158 /DNA_ID=CAMNT_0002395043 /DNA_START=65 /DNA_END=541 /DNA_ORIENTATION=-
MSDQEFESTESGASLTIPSQAGALKKGAHAILKGHPCKIVEITTSKTGKHGHAKANITGLDIFTNKKYEDSCPTSHNMDVPVVVRKEYQVINIDGDYVELMNDQGDTKGDVKIPTEGGDVTDVGKQLQEMFDEGKDLGVIVLAAMEQEKIIQVKEITN